ARAHVFAVICGAIGKPSGLLMIVSSFGPCDLVSGVFGFFEQWQGGFLESSALLFQDVECFVEDGMDILGNYVEEKLLGNAESKFAWLSRRFFQGARTGFAFDELEDGFEKESGIMHSASQRASAVQPQREWNDVRYADAAESGFEPDDAAE